jgi:hypothetical protein
MEDVQQPIIPTLSRAKISRNLSYPIGAEHISAALASTSQMHALKLHFYSGFDIGLRSGQYEFLRVEYLNEATPAEKWPISSLYKRPPQYRWEIVVQPVPRALRHRIQQYTIDSALPQIMHWLLERAELAQRGNDILAFFYDEKAEEFTPRHLTHLEPLRNR